MTNNKFHLSGIGNVQNHLYMGDGPVRAPMEVITLTQVIVYLCNEVEHYDGVLDIENQRDLNKKINQRFAPYKEKIYKDYQTLLFVFDNKYKLAWQNSDVSEQQRDQIDAFISIKSRRVLEENANNPIHSIDILVQWLREEIGKNHENKKQFSDVAIRFFLYKEFVRCNVFPN